MRSELGKPAVARRLAATRAALNEGDQQKFAEGAGLKQNAYNQYESAKRLISLNAAIKLCDAYHLTLDWIYRGDPSSLPYGLATMLRNKGALLPDEPPARAAKKPNGAPARQSRNKPSN